MHERDAGRGMRSLRAHARAQPGHVRSRLPTPWFLRASNGGRAARREERGRDVSEPETAIEREAAGTETKGEI